MPSKPLVITVARKPAPRRPKPEPEAKTPAIVVARKPGRRWWRRRPPEESDPPAK
jgi:hypothetical protein